MLQLAQHNPGDVTAIMALLLNPVTLAPGEVLYTPPGTPHVYISGLALEVMAASDNVLRFGATKKHVDRQEALRITDFHAAPPVRIAGETNAGGVHMFYAPIDDFELGVADIKSAVIWPRRGPRVVICLAGNASACCDGKELQLQRGQALFIADGDGVLSFSGNGKVAVISVP